MHWSWRQVLNETWGLDHTESIDGCKFYHAYISVQSNGIAIVEVKYPFECGGADVFARYRETDVNKAKEEILQLFGEVW